MIITVFGATGLVGRHIVKMALWQGHTVRAYGRNVHELIADEERNENLHLYKGGVFDEADVKKAIAGADVVLSALGGDVGGADKTRSLGMKTIIEAMKETGVQRIIAIGGMGILDAPDGSGYLFEGEEFPAEYVPVSQEHFKAFGYLQDSGLQWTLLAPLTITDAAVTGEYATAANTNPDGQSRITAGDLAAFMLKEMTGNQFVNMRVGISN